ncbi:hypothetical protein C8R44DRAFT_90492 [Mycena epipterygia]|nr:hypothetical protein C8R44DRAFT_90492 [Mycena epipterygia]
MKKKCAFPAFLSTFHLLPLSMYSWFVTVCQHKLFEKLSARAVFLIHAACQALPYDVSRLLNLMLPVLRVAGR